MSFANAMRRSITGGLVVCFGVAVQCATPVLHAQQTGNGKAKKPDVSIAGLPPVKSVASMIGTVSEPDAVLMRTPKQSAYIQATRDSNENGDRMLEHTMKSVAWTRPDFYSRPLYFEQVNFERYRTATPAWAQPVVSYGAFLGTIPVLPYKMGVHAPTDRVYVVGHYAEGQDAPRRVWNGTLSKRGVLYQAAATTGVVFLVP